MRHLLTAIALLLLLPARAQDLLYLRNGSYDTVTVTDITRSQIIYRKHHRPNGPLYATPNTDVLMIAWPDGTVETFEGNNHSNPLRRQRYLENLKNRLGKNIVSINLFNLLAGNLHFGYERIVNPWLGLKLSANTKIGSTEADLGSYARCFTTGFDINLYPAGQGKIKYFVGPAFRMGRLESYYSLFRVPYVETYSYYSLLFNNGFYIQPTAGFYISFQGGFGIARVNKIADTGGALDLNRPKSIIDGMLSFNVGLRF